MQSTQTTPVTLDVLHESVQALTAAVERMAAHQPLVDLQTAADHLGVSKRTLRRLVERHDVPFRRIGRALRFNLALLAPRPADARRLGRSTLVR